MKAYADITTSALGISHKDRRITKVNWVKNLLYSTGNSAERYVAAWMRGVSGGERIPVYVAESLCCSLETITAVLISYTPIQNKKLKKKSFGNDRKCLFKT